MATIDNLDISIYNLYAVRTRMIEETNQQLRLREAAGVRAHAERFDLFAKLPEMQLLFGIGKVASAFAHFIPPDQFEELYRAFISLARVAPSFGPTEKHEEILNQLETIVCNGPKEIKEKADILHCLETMDEINGWMEHIIGRKGQFLQG